MNAECCGVYKRAGWSVSRRIRGRAGWLVPAAILTFLPKCPACLAVYIAMGTGIGIPFTTAKYLRGALLMLSLASLAYFAVRQSWARDGWRATQLNLVWRVADRLRILSLPDRFFQHGRAKNPTFDRLA